MRLLLDANLSPRRIGDPIAAAGHDVACLADEPTLEGLDDPDVLAHAAAHDRTLVTRNSRDFAPLLRQWMEAGRRHPGCILIWTLRTNQFGAIVTAVTEALDARPDPHDWRDLTIAI